MIEGAICLEKTNHPGMHEVFQFYVLRKALQYSRSDVVNLGQFSHHKLISLIELVALLRNHAINRVC